MTTYQWTENTTPDRPGIWLAQSDLTGTVHTINVYRENIGSWAVGKYCFLMDWPEVADPPKYREPTAADVGREDVEFSDDRKTWESPGVLDAVITAANYPFIHVDEVGNILGWKHARVLDDGQPQREPRELFINEYAHGLSGSHYRSLEKAKRVATPGVKATIHFVEVIESVV